DRLEAIALQQRLQLFLRPTPHHEVKRTGSLLVIGLQRVLLVDEELPTHRLERGHASEREQASTGGDPLSEEGFPSLALLRRFPFADIENQHACLVQDSTECRKHRLTHSVIEKIVEHATAEDRIVPRSPELGDVADAQ